MTADLRKRVKLNVSKCILSRVPFSNSPYKNRQSMKKVLALYMRDSISRNAFCPLSLQFSTWKNSRIVCAVTASLGDMSSIL